MTQYPRGILGPRDPDVQITTGAEPDAYGWYDAADGYWHRQERHPQTGAVLWHGRSRNITGPYESLPLEESAE